MAKAIFSAQNEAVSTGCVELRNLLRDAKNEGVEVKQILDTEVLELREKLEDVSAALLAKKVLIKDLEKGVQQVKAENASYKEEVEKVRAQSDAEVSPEGRVNNCVS